VVKHKRGEIQMTQRTITRQQNKEGVIGLVLLIIVLTAELLYLQTMEKEF
jgi:hypothetical protein